LRGEKISFGGRGRTTGFDITKAIFIPSPTSEVIDRNWAVTGESLSMTCERSDGRIILTYLNDV
jgi:hypothetical protein